MGRYRCLLLVATPLFVVGTAVPAHRENDGKKEKATLECRIIVVANKIENGNYVALLEVEIKNTSGKPFDLRYTYVPPILQYMAREVRGPDGDARFRCVDYLSPYSMTPLTETIRPGEAIRERFGRVGSEGPGKYRVRAVFEYENVKVISPVVEIELEGTKD